MISLKRSNDTCISKLAFERDAVLEEVPSFSTDFKVPTPNLNTENEQPQTTQEENQPTEGDVAPLPSETPEYSDGNVTPF